MIQLHIPDINEDDKEAVASCLASGWVSTAGPQVEAFEEGLKKFTGSPFVVALNSGTSALHLALLAAGAGPGKKVIAPALSFVATANAVSYTGAQLIFADTDASGFMDPAIVADFLKKNGSGDIVAIVPVSLYGYPLDPQPWLEISHDFHVKIIEDAAEAVGSFRAGQHAGTAFDAAVLSFNGNKVMTSGSGGAFLTGDPQQAALVKHLSLQARINAREYIHDAIGFNYRMTAMSAALGSSQLGRLPAMLETRRKLAKIYDEAFASSEQVFPLLRENADIQWNHWIYPIRCQDSWQLESFLESHGIRSQKPWVPLPKLGIFRECPYLQSGKMAMQVYQESLFLPLHAQLTEEQAVYIADKVLEFY